METKNSKLSRDQWQHVKSRLSYIECRQREAIDKACVVIDKTKPISCAEFTKRVKAGQIKPRKVTPGGNKLTVMTVTNRTRLTDVFDYFPPKYQERDLKKHNAMTQAHHAKWERIWDEVLLASSADILSIIRREEG